MVANSSPAAVLTVTIFLTVLCMVFVVLRFWTAVRQKSKPKLDDWLCLAALLLTIGMAAAIITGVVKKSLGYPAPSDPELKDTRSMEIDKIEWAVQMIQCFQLGLTKLSFVVLFRRLFITGTKRSIFSIVTWAVIVLLVAWTAAFFLGFLFASGTHFDHWWLKHSQAVSMAFEETFAMSDILIDLIIFFIPIPLIWRLRMPTYRKVAVTAVFTLGALAVIMSIIRFAVFYEAKLAEAPGKTFDRDLIITTIVFWSLIESATALIAACLPVVYGLFGRYFVDRTRRAANSVMSMVSPTNSGRRGSCVSLSSPIEPKLTIDALVRENTADLSLKDIEAFETFVMRDKDVQAPFPKAYIPNV